NRCCCPGEGFSQDYSALISAVAVVLPQGLRYAASVGLAGAFWRVFPERRLGGSGGGCPRLCMLVKVLPRIALCRFWWRFFPGVLCVCFGATVVLPLWFEVCRLVGLRSVYLGIVGRGTVPLAVHLAAALASLSRCLFSSSSVALVGLHDPVAQMVCFVSRALRALVDGGLGGDAPLWYCVARVRIVATF
ncbi:hypothetical protein Taro_028867, partial [Colocasia esculenta]|nr:hypothetical protein [Colocasia esculenta]